MSTRNLYRKNQFSKNVNTTQLRLGSNKDAITNKIKYLFFFTQNTTQLRLGSKLEKKFKKNSRLKNGFFYVLIVYCGVYIVSVSNCEHSH